MRIILIIFIILAVTKSSLAEEGAENRFVYRITVSVKDNINEFVVQTGFQVKGLGIITALHGISYGDRIMGRCYSDYLSMQPMKELRIIALNFESDIALLSSDQIDLSKGFEIGLLDPAMYGDNTSWVSFSYPWGMRAYQIKKGYTLSNSQLTVSLSEVLSGNDPLLAEFLQFKSPSLNLKVITTTGVQFESGDSGCPIIFKGKVIGMLDGGIGSVSWSVPLSGIKWKPYVAADRPRLSSLRLRNSKKLYQIFTGIDDRENVFAEMQPMIWRANDIPHGCGTFDGYAWVSRPNDICWIDGNGVKGYPNYGPYIPLKKGTYEVTWTLAITNDAPGDKYLAQLHVADYERDQAVKSTSVINILRTHFKSTEEFQEFTSTFSVDSSEENHRFEFRVWTEGVSTLKFAEVRFKQIN